MFGIRQIKTNISYLVMSAILMITNIAYGEVNVDIAIKELEKEIEYERVNSINVFREFKNIDYVYKEQNALPTIYEQIIFCYSESKVWLELTNFEFLINGKESKRLITAFVGISAEGAKKEKNVQRKRIAISDPESAFVFQDSVLAQYNSISQENNANPIVNLGQAIKVGYHSIDYHFGYTNALDVKNINIASINSLEELFNFIESCNQEKYNEEENIKKIENLGFTAYYSNPIYLGRIAIYLRPKNVDYSAYYNANKIDSKFQTGNPGVILKNNASVEQNEYYEHIKRAHPDHTKVLGTARLYLMTKKPEDKDIPKDAKHIIVDDVIYVVNYHGTLEQMGKGDWLKEITNNIEPNNDVPINLSIEAKMKIKKPLGFFLGNSSDLVLKYTDFKPLTYKNFKPLPPSYVFKGTDQSLVDVYNQGGFKSKLALDMIKCDFYIIEENDFSKERINTFINENNLIKDVYIFMYNSKKDSLCCTKVGHYAIREEIEIVYANSNNNLSDIINELKANIAANNKENIIHIIAAKTTYSNPSTDVYGYDAGIMNSWEFSECNGLNLCSDKMYISASRTFSVARVYGSNDNGIGGFVFAIFTTRAIDMPYSLEDENGNYFAYETVIPEKVDWSDIVGSRETSKKFEGVFKGPVFLKNNLAVEDVTNFWKLLELFGEKTQITKKDYNKRILDLLQNYKNHSLTCAKTWKILYGTSMENSKAGCMVYADDVDIMPDEAINPFIDKAMFFANATKRNN